MPGNNSIREIKTRLSVDGETAFRKSIKSVDSSLKAMKSELKLVRSGFDDSTDSMYKNEREAEVLKKMQEQLKVKVDALTGATDDAAKAYEDARKEAEKLTAEYGENSNEAKIAWQQVETLGNKMDRMVTQSNNAESYLNDVTEQLKNVGTKADDAKDKSKDAADNGFTVLKGAAANLVSEGLSVMLDSLKDIVTELGNADSAYNNFAIKTGASAKDMEQYSDAIMSLYKSNYGDSLSDVSDSMATVKQLAGDIPTDKLQEVTEYAIALDDAFGYDVAESMRTVNSLADQFGASYSDAFDLIVQGAQKGLDQNGDMLDTFNEYSVQFKDMGYTAEEMFNMLSNAAETGTWSVDKLGDAVKEFNIKLSEGSADEALAKLGFGTETAAADAEAYAKASENLEKSETALRNAEVNLEKVRISAIESENAYNEALNEHGENSLEAQKALANMNSAYNSLKNAEDAVTSAQKGITEAQSEQISALNATETSVESIKLRLAEGGVSAKMAQQEIINALMSVEDEQERYVLGQQLMGTMWEDLGETTVAALFNTQGEISTTKDAMQEVIDLKYDDIGHKLEKVSRKAKDEIVKPLVEKALPKIEDGIEWVSENLDDLVPVIETVGTAVVTVFAVKKIVEFGKTTVNTIKTIKTAFTALNTTNPLGWIQIGVTAVTSLGTAFIAAKKKSENFYKGIRNEAEKFSEKQQKISENISDTAEKWQDFTTNRSTMDDEVNIEYQKVNDLKTALDGLVNADGTVRKGSEEEVRTILESLSGYTGVVLEISDGVLTKNGEVIKSYQELSTEIDALLEKQRASALMAVYEQQYTETAAERKKLLEDVTDAQAELRAVNEEITALTTKQMYVFNGTLPLEMQAELDGLRNKRDELLEVYAAGQDSLVEMANFITQYESATAAMSSGDYNTVIENMNKISAGFATANTASAGQLKKQYEEFAESYKEIVRLHETNPGIYTEKDVEDAKKLMDLALQEYEKKTNEFIDTSAITGREYIKGLAYSTISNSEKLDSARKYIEKKLADGEELKEIAKDLGIDYDETLSTALKNGHISIGSASNYLANTVLNEFKSSNPKLISATNQNMADVVGAIKNSKPANINAILDISNSMAATLYSNSGNFYNAGQQNGTDYIAGLKTAVNGLALDINGHSVWSPLAQFALPHFATGTDNFKGGFAVINENQKGELVNLPDGSQVIPHDISLKYAEEAASRASVTNNTFGNININISAPNLNGQASARAVAFEISDKVVSQIAEKIDRQKNRYSSAIGR